ncbi:hypothetical protein JAMGFMIE_00388 [Rheinheimera sp. MM224]|nr:hypothetical protein JAMGFMIE_00388 [Rheinheimera sp. MM224]
MLLKEENVAINRDTRREGKVGLGGTYIAY